MNFWSILLFAQEFKTLLVMSLIALMTKGCVLAYLYSSKHVLSRKTVNLRRILSVILFCTMVTDSAWVLVLLLDLSFIASPAPLAWSWVRFSWLSGFVYHVAVAVFMRYVTQKEMELSRKNFLRFIPSLLVCCAYIVCMIVNYHTENVGAFEYYLRFVGELSGIFLLMLPGMFYAEKVIRNGTVPRILGLQIRWAMVAFIVPYLMGDILSIIPMEGMGYALFCATESLFLSAGMFIVGRKLLRLRFLNLRKQVTAPPRSRFAIEMERVADELRSVTNLSELHHIVRVFFEKSFSLPGKKVHFYLNSNELDSRLELRDSDSLNALRSFFAKEEETTIAQIRQDKVLVFDELVFSDFYEHDPVQEKYIALLNTINADILLPLFKQNKVIAYIVVDKNARQNRLYSNAESNEMGVFADGIGNMVTILQSNHFELSAKRERELQKKLYTEKQRLEAILKDLDGKLSFKTQENKQYKESLRTFLYGPYQRGIGLLLYKNRRFVCANRVTKELIPIDLNLYPGDPVTKELTRIARSVEQYRDAHSCIIKDSNGKKLVVSAVPSIEQNAVNTVIMMIHSPEISDLIKKQMDLLKDPERWEYLLYLETTRVGRLVDEALPGATTSVINIKIELLKAALCRRSSLIVAALDDVGSLVALLHQISMRDTLYMLKLGEPSKSSEIAMKLFGVNPLMCSKDVAVEQPLLKKLDKVGTLYIEQVENLTLDAQKKLADYISYGYFSSVGSKEQIVSNVRIICSTNQNLKAKVQEGLFDVRLHQVLERSSVHMPSLAVLDSSEFKAITEDIASESLSGVKLAELVTLSDNEKKRLAKDPPSSFIRLQSKIEAILDRKSREKKVAYGSNLDGVDMDDPTVSRAMRLGKKTLSDKKLVQVLWDKFKSQNKIAILLGVHRSSVLRRCQEYGIGSEQIISEGASVTPDSSDLDS